MYLLESIKRTDEYLEKRKEDDDCAHYGKFIAAQLRKLTEYQQDVARKEINDVLWKIKWGSNENNTSYEI